MDKEEKLKKLLEKIEQTPDKIIEKAIDNLSEKMDKEEIEDKEIQDFLKFMTVADNEIKERGKIYKFTCPLCNGEAEGIKNTYNGDLWAKCEKCEMNVIQ